MWAATGNEREPVSTIRRSPMQFEESRPYCDETRITRPDLHAIEVDGQRRRSIVPGSICADHGCDLVHPGTTHDVYDARFDHALTCQACRQACAVLTSFTTPGFEAISTQTATQDLGR
jgi:hypothetical protein